MKKLAVIAFGGNALFERRSKRDLQGTDAECDGNMSVAAAIPER